MSDNPEQFLAAVKTVALKRNAIIVTSDKVTQ